MRIAVAGPVAATFIWMGCVASGVVEERPSQDGGPGAGPGVFEEAGGPCERHCSRDLRSIDDCHGRAVEACSDDQGCSNAACISACAAADAARGTLGCEFFVAPLAVQQRFSDSNPDGACAATMIVNAGRVPVSVSISHQGKPIDIAGHGRIPITRSGTFEYAPLPPDGKVPADGIAIFFLRQTAEGLCPVPALTTGPMVKGTGFGEAFRIETSHPVSAYSVLPSLDQNTTLALLYPFAAWDTSYVAAIGEPSDHEREYIYLQDEQTGFVVVAKEPTTVIVTPSADMVGKADAGIRSVAAGGSRHFDLGASGVLRISQRENLSGTVIVSDKPVAVFAEAMWFPQTARHQQLPPVRATGHRYAAVRPRDRTAPFPEKHGWRFVGMVDGTKLTYRPAPPLDAPLEIGRGTVVEIETGDRFVVESQDAEHPFALIEGTRTAVGTQFGQVLFESVPAVSLDQFVSSQLFYTVPVYQYGHLVVVREADADGAFHEVELDCVGGVSGWKSIDTEGHYQYALLDTPMFDYEKQTSYCDLGRRAMRSDATFGVTVWGFNGSYSGYTYAYPAAVGLRAVNNVRVDVQ